LNITTSVIKSNVSYFQAFNPKRILNYIEERRKKLKEEEDKIKEILPQLVQKQKKEAEQSARVYSGFNGLKTLYDEIIEHLKKTKEDFIAFTLGEEYEDEKLIRFFEHYDLIRRGLKIKTKLIGVEKQRKFFKKSYLKEAGLEVKFLPYASLPQGVIIFGDKVATMVWGANPTAFVIQSKQTAKTYKEFFWDLWKKAKK